MARKKEEVELEIKEDVKAIISESAETIRDSVEYAQIVAEEAVDSAETVVEEQAAKVPVWVWCVIAIVVVFGGLMYFR